MDLACAICETYRFELDVFESLQLHCLGHFPMPRQIFNTLGRPLPVSLWRKQGQSAAGLHRRMAVGKPIRLSRARW
jgi:hypothetical protein